MRNKTFRRKFNYKCGLTVCNITLSAINIDYDENSHYCSAIERRYKEKQTQNLNFNLILVYLSIVTTSFNMNSKNKQSNFCVFFHSIPMQSETKICVENLKSITTETSINLAQFYY